MASGKSLLIVLIGLSLTGCVLKKQENVQLSDLNFFLKTDSKIDSVFIANITQDKLYKFLPYSDTIQIDSDNPINDLYEINFYGDEKFRMNRIWLSGENVIIRGYVNDELQLEIDTVIGTDLYYKSLAYNTKLKELKKQDGARLNDFQLESFKDNISNPFSIDIANDYFFRNISNKEALSKLYELLVQQDSTISMHLWNPIKRVEKVLFETRIDLSPFQFYNTEGELTSLSLEAGKKYLLDFWFVGCAPCVQDHKVMAEKMPLLKKHGIEVVGISIDNRQSMWLEYLQSKNYDWFNVREIDDQEKKATKSMLIYSFPTYILVDSDGNVLHRSFSISEVLKYIG
jgi:thiol-disulfide isomerase/thioredoxin